MKNPPLTLLLGRVQAGRAAVGHNIGGVAMWVIKQFVQQIWAAHLPLQVGEWQDV